MEEAARAKATQLLLGLNMEFSREEFTDGRPASALLVYFSGIISFSAGPAGFPPMRPYTPYPAALIYVQRLLFIVHSLPARAHPFLGILQRPQTDQLRGFMTRDRIIWSLIRSLHLSSSFPLWRTGG